MCGGRQYQSVYCEKVKRKWLIEMVTTAAVVMGEVEEEEEKEKEAVQEVIRNGEGGVVW